MPRERLGDLARGCGLGISAGLVASVLSHWVWAVNFLALPLVFTFSLFGLRGWSELAGLHAMIATTVSYFAVLDILAIDSFDRRLVIGSAVLVMPLFLLYMGVATTAINRRRIRARRAAVRGGLDLDRHQQWEEPYFARLRQLRTAPGVGGRAPFAWPIAMAALAFAAGVLFSKYGSRAAASLAWGVAFFHALVFGRMAQYARRLNQTGAQLAIATSARRPILFLRPFALDAFPVHPFEQEGWRAFSPYSWVDKRTFEEHLAATFEDLGPVIAIGRPREEVAPLGASREYVGDGSWQASVLERAAMSQFVIMEVDATPGVMWEFEHVSKLVGVQHVLLVFPPRHALSGQDDWWQERWEGLRAEFPFLPSVSPNTAAVLFDAGDSAILINWERRGVLKTLTAIRQAWLTARSEVPDEAGWSSPEYDAVDNDAEAPHSAPERAEQSALPGLLAHQARLRVRIVGQMLRHGRYHPRTLATQRELALVLIALGDLTKARRLQEAVIAAYRRRNQSGDAPALAAALRERVGTLRLSGEPGAVRSAAEELLDTAVRTPRQEPVETPLAQIELAIAMRDQGELGPARSLLERIVESPDASLVPHDVRRASRVLASVLVLSGDYQAATQLLTRLLEEARARGGDGHMDALETMSLLAEALSGLGRHQDAARHAREALEGYEREFGTGHPVTMKPLINVARISARAGDLVAARTFGERAVAESRRVLGDQHRDTLLALSIYGTIRVTLGELEPAQELFLLAWTGRRRVLGETHMDTLTALSNLAHAQLSLGNTEEAGANFARAVAGYERTLGPDHPFTLFASSNLATVTAGTNLAAARVAHERVVARARDHLGSQHRDTAVMIVNLATTAAKQGDVARAGPLLEEAIGVLASTFGEAHPYTINARASLEALADYT